ncbi:MAG TPA: NADH-quinone oxidoreductase subunit L [bacterium]
MVASVLAPAAASGPVPATAPLVGWTVLLAPLAAALCVQLFGVRRRRFSGVVAIAGLLASFAGVCWLFAASLQGALPLPYETAVTWIELPGLTVSFGVLIDRLSLLMALVVTGVGSAIFLYSAGYMADDHAYSRYFGMLSLFAFSMLTVVLGTNWIQLFMGWELVGFSSYMLIGHWYAKPSAAEAGKKAFIVNRVADFGFLLGILWLWAASGAAGHERTMHFLTLERQIPQMAEAGVLGPGVLTAIALLIFCGPIGKSAQFPLHVWLPDAMEGPTPVSALIHAATMVAAGVYLLCRVFWLIALSPAALGAVMWVGAATALLAALLALVENDLKRILAYSTLSQLGYMVMALGLGGVVAGMYHLTTHAFFKALLFLAAGSVIHGTHEQDIWKLGGLRRSMPLTSLAFLVGGLSLCGFPGLSGFFSKDEILVLAHERHLGAYWLGTITAGLTAFYIARAWFVAFTGSSRAHGHESPWIMLGPLALLSLLSIAGGYAGIPQFLGAHHGPFHWNVAMISLGVVAAGLLAGWLLYGPRPVRSDSLVSALAAPAALLRRRYYLDDAYDWYVATVQQRLIAGCCAWFERVLIIGAAVNGTAWATAAAGRLLRRCQTGRVQTYVLVFLFGLVWLIYASGRP